VSTRWDYLTLTWTHSVSEVNGATQRDSGWQIRGKGGLETNRPGTDPLIEVLVDLGDQGWELVGEAGQSTTEVASQGYPKATTPLRVRWIFKRPL
jgi:hypothetical protein